MCSSSLVNDGKSRGRSLVHFLWRWQLLLVLVFGVLGCQRFLGDDNKPTNQLWIRSIEGQGADCVTHLAEKFESYRSGRDDRAQVEKLFVCLQNSLEVFSDRTRGEDRYSYSFDEIHYFLEKFFVPGGTLDRGQLQSVFKLKVLMFGGSADRVTRAEMLRIRLTLADLASASHDLAPDARILFGVNSEPDDSAQNLMGLNQAALKLEAAIRKLQKWGLKLNAHFCEGPCETDRTNHQLSVERFSFSDLGQALTNLGVNGFDFSEHRDFYLSVKNILFGDRSEFFASGDISSLMTYGLEIYSQRLRFRLFAEKSLFRDVPSETWRGAIDDMMATLARAVAHHQGQKITVAEIKEFIYQVQARHWLLSDLPQKLVSNLTDVIFIKVLKSSPKEPVLAKAELNDLGALLMSWNQGQALIDQIFLSRERLPFWDFYQQLGSRDDRVVTLADARQSAVDIRSELGFLSTRLKVHEWRDDGLVRLVPASDSDDAILADLRFLNFSRSVARLIFRSYIHDVDRLANGAGMKEAEAQELYFDVRDLGVFYGQIDERYLDSGSKRFTEGNLFSSLANGDEFLSLAEAIELFQMVISGGRIANRVYDEALLSCKSNTTDIQGRSEILASCFRTLFQNRFAVWNSHVPGIVNALKAKGRDPVFWNEFFKAWESTARGAGMTDAPFEASDILTGFPVLQYVENLFLRFDHDLDGTLDSDEIWQAFPVIKETIRRLGDGKTESEFVQKAVYSYILTFGEPPAPTIVGNGGLAAWAIARHFYSESADRLKLLQVIGSIAAYSRTVNKSKVADFFSSQKGSIGDLLSRADSQTLNLMRRLFLCQESVQAEFNEAMRSQVNEVVTHRGPKGELSSQEFERNVKQVIVAHKVLSRHCAKF